LARKSSALPAQLCDQGHWLIENRHEGHAKWNNIRRSIEKIFG
jgi:hypothetical protein